MEKSIENLPFGVDQLHKKIDNIERLLLSNIDKEAQQNDRLFTVDEAAKFLSLSVPTIYALNRQGELPVIKKGKRCYYFEQDLLEYLRTGRRKSKHQIGDDVSKYLKSNKLI